MSIEEQIIATTRKMIDAMYNRDVDVYRECCADDISAFEWYIAKLTDVTG